MPKNERVPCWDYSFQSVFDEDMQSETGRPGAFECELKWYWKPPLELVLEECRFHLAIDKKLKTGDLLIYTFLEGRPEDMITEGRPGS